jgi:hypothetical protein
VKQKSDFGCLGAIVIGLLLLVFWTAVAFTVYFFIFFYPLRLVVGVNRWKISPDGARLVFGAMLGLPVVGALWFGWQGGLAWFLIGAWMGVGLSFWLHWALQDALPEDNPATKNLLRSRA